jgi:transcriptional regulator with XRE-family HTH domain
MEHWFNVEAFYKALDAEREERKLSWRQLATEAGVPSSSIFTRLAKGNLPDGENLLAILRWLRLDVNAFFDLGEKKEPGTLATISLALQSDTCLSEDGKAIMDDMVRSTYMRLCQS